ncbi:MAG TPA: ABC transporter ATP-binding protein [Planctomycetota bacterium]|jgi:ABC-type polysaccharide/polyol phosphate transport system ATPase subunit
MTNDSHIQLRDIGLSFRLYANKSFSLREMFLSPLRGKQSSTFDALKRVSLDIEHGDRVVLIGPNGAGKSSLLKIVAGIYPATSGEISIRGRITPLIEMGAGFNPELTGRENVFLNAAILGFSRAEAERRLPRIMEFSEIPPDFLDTGIKYYSSGMMMRLAFSVAMEMEPQILILDEIFAAGDAHFLEKATRRMQEFIASAHIMILVTHDLELARSVARRCIWLDHGQVVQDGPVEKVIPAYQAAMHQSAVLSSPPEVISKQA